MQGSLLIGLDVIAVTLCETEEEDQPAALAMSNNRPQTTTFALMGLGHSLLKKKPAQPRIYEAALDLADGCAESFVGQLLALCPARAWAVLQKDRKSTRRNSSHYCDSRMP